MIPVDLSRAGTQATTPRRDKPAGVGDAAFGVQMQKALAAGPSDRPGGGDRPHVSAPPAADRGHAGRARASEDARSLARNAGRNSGMEGAGPEPGASAPFVQSPGLPAARTETVPADAATITAQAGAVSGAIPAGVPLAGTPAAGLLVAEPVAVELPAPPMVPSAGGNAGQASTSVLSTTAAPQVPPQSAAGAAGTVAAAKVPGLPAGSVIPAGMTRSAKAPDATPSTTAAAVATTMELAPGAAASGISGGGHIGTAATGTASGVVSGTAATAAAPGNVGGETANQAQPGVVLAPTMGAPGAPAQTPAAAPPPAAAQVPAPHPPLAGQLSGPLFSLASARAGEHTMTLSVTPENLGPVTVRAHIGAEGVRVELFAPNDAGREALRAILQDLKRDLASAGLGTNLDLSARSGSDDGAQDGADELSGERASNGQRQFQAVTPLAPPGQQIHPHLRNAGTTGLDVLA